MIEVDATITTAYKADDLGDTKPKVLIGGTTAKFVPNLNIGFQCATGSEQYYINLNRKSVVVSAEASSFVDGKVSLAVGDESDIWHIDDKGRLKWDIEFAKKPASNIIEWEILHSNALSFYYQDALTQEEMDAGCIRADDVVGSYAVYCDKSGDIQDLNDTVLAKYATGKLCHIYRPLCFDAVGEKAWAELLIEDSVLRVTIPQKFLDDATYPVTLDPNFGYETGGSSYEAVYNNYMTGTVFTSPSDAASATSLTWTSFGSGSTFKAIIALHSSLGLVTNAIGAGVANTGSIVWHTDTFGTPPTIAASTAYVLMIVSASDGYLAYDAGDTNQAHTDTSNSYSSPTDPTDASHTNRKHSIYCTYTAGGGGGLVIPVVMGIFRRFLQG